MFLVPLTMNFIRGGSTAAAERHIAEEIDPKEEQQHSMDADSEVNAKASEQELHNDGNEKQLNGTSLSPSNRNKG